MWKLKAITVTLSLAALGILQGAAKGGCGGENLPGIPGVDVGGPGGADWDVMYGDVMHVDVKKGGAVIATHNISVAAGGSFQLDGVTVELNKICQDPEIACPEEVFPKTVRMTQPGSERHLLYVTFAKEGPLGDLKQTTLLGNVNSNQDVDILLGVGAAAAGICGLVSVSTAKAHIKTDAGDPPRGTEMNGHIITGYAGGCILSGQGGTAGAGLTVELKLPFSATRTN